MKPRQLLQLVREPSANFVAKMFFRQSTASFACIIAQTRSVMRLPDEPEDPKKKKGSQ
jgi:hypothetical protein